MKFNNEWYRKASDEQVIIKLFIESIKDKVKIDNWEAFESALVYKDKEVCTKNKKYGHIVRTI